MSSSDLSDVESELTDLEETAPTPGRAPSAEQDSGIHFHAAGPDMQQAQASSSKSKAPQRASGRRKSLRGAAAASNDVAADPQPQQPQQAMSPQADASTSASTSRRRIKITSRPQSRATSPAAEVQQQQSAEAASKAPKKGIKLNIGRSKAQQQQDDNKASPDVPPSAPQVGSSSFRDTLKDLGDSEEDEEEEVIAPAKRGTRRPRASNAASPGDDAAAQAGETSQQKIKKRKPESAKQRSGSALKKPRRNKGDSDEDAQLESDSDEEMQDAASSDDYEEGEGGAPKRKGGKASAGKSKAGAVKAAKSQDGAKGKSSAATGKNKAAAGKKQQGSEADSKSAVGKIRASAAVTAAAASAASSSSSPSQTVDSPLAGPGNTSLSSPIPPTPRKAPQPPGATAPPRRPMPMPMKPRGSDMWDSLVGSSKPRPPPVPARPLPGAQQPKKDGADQQKNNGPRPPRPPPSAPPGLPRPLGTTGTPLGPSGSSSIARPRSSYPGSTSRDAYSSTSNGSFIVHMTPGLNGQHWDKAAYRQLRQSECYAYSNPDPGSLFNLLEDAELVQRFEDEWKETKQAGYSAFRDAVKKQGPGQGQSHHGGGETERVAEQQQQQLVGQPLFSSCSFSQYGSGRRYADDLKEEGKFEATLQAARMVREKEKTAMAMPVGGPAGQGSTTGEVRAR